MFIIDEDEVNAVDYNSITSLSVDKFSKGYVVRAETPNDAIVLARFKGQPRLGAIISSMWYANIRGSASWQYNDPT